MYMSYSLTTVINLGVFFYLVLRYCVVTVNMDPVFRRFSTGGLVLGYSAAGREVLKKGVKG